MKSATNSTDELTDSTRTTKLSESSAISFILEAGWVITMDEQMRVLQEHSLVVIDGRIVACLPWAESVAQYPNMVIHDRRTGILMPGLVNAHTHLAMNLLRGFADDKPLKSWLEQHVWPTEATHLSPEYVRDGTALALAESLLCGVTTVNDMYFFADVTAATVRNAGMRATVGLLVLDIPTAWANSVDEYISRGLAVHDTLLAEPLISTAFAPHAPYTVPRQALERIATLSAELDVPVHMHVHETVEEVQSFEREHGIRPIARLDEIGLLNSSLLAVHLTQLHDTEIVRLAEVGVHAIHCPQSNLKLASGVSPVAELMAAGVNVAVGTDGAASNNDLDLLSELRTASLLAKMRSGDAAILPAARALRVVTIDAAKALGLAEQIGSLEPGKSADCIIIEPGLGMLPIYDVMAQVLYTQSSQYVTDVWVAGRQLLRNRQLLTMDIEKIRRNSIAWAQKISTTL